MKSSVEQVKSQDAISPLNKGLGALAAASRRADISTLGWNLLREDVSLPAAVLDQSKLQHNLAWMARFISAYGMKLAPHGKTTMAPALFKMQLDSGAWGITVATAQQAHVAYAHGVRRVLMANELVGKTNMVTIAQLLSDPSFEFYCIVDSAKIVHHLGEFFESQNRRLNVLIEIGVDGGRTGVRSEEQLQAVIEALEMWQGSIALSGIEVYEGVLSDEASIRTFLKHAISVTRHLLSEDRFVRKPAILTGAGSAWYDIVAEEFADAQFGDAAELVLRPGCYLTHDVGAYREAQDRILKQNPIAHEMHSGLVPALRIWAYVQSVPEGEKAIIGMGKRDAAFDSGLPTPALHFRPGDECPHDAPTHWNVTKMMDQHAFLEIALGDDLRVGDMIAFDVSHPCLTFDKWRTMLLVNDAYDVIDVIETFF